MENQKAALIMNDIDELKAIGNDLDDLRNMYCRIMKLKRNDYIFEELTAMEAINRKFINDKRVEYAKAMEI